MQKVKIEYAKFRTNGFLLDLIVKALEIFQVEDKLQKTYQRFVKEEEISAQEYHDTLNTLIEDILINFFNTTDSKEFEYFESIIKEFLSFYNQHKLYNETLVTTQKQLDFIVIINLFIPFINHFIFEVNLEYKKDLFIIDTILPDERQNSIQKVFNILKNSFSDNITLKEELFRILYSKKLENYDTTGIDKDIDNWINGKFIPQKEHIEMISELAEFSSKFSKKELENYLKLAKLVQLFFDKSKNHFGIDLTELLIKHYKMITTISFLHLSKKLDSFFQSYNLIEKKKFKEYYDNYFDRSINIFYAIKHFALNEYVENKYEKVQDILNDCQKYEERLYKIYEKSFFQKINHILPLRYLDRKSIIVGTSDLDINDIDMDFYEYSQDIAKLYSLVDPRKQKSEIDDKNFIDLVKELGIKYEVKGDQYLSFLQARFYAQKRDYEQATEYYLKALEFGKNCMGYHIKPVIKEGLFVSAQNTRKDQLDLVNAKSAFTKFYKEAYFYKLIDNLPDEINQYFLSDMKKQFDLYFKNLFPNVKKAKDKDIAKNLGIGITEERLKIKIDFDKPDKLIKEFYKNSMSQLMHCCSLGSYDYVKRLIKEGADINYTKPYDNYTALIATLENKVDDIKIDIAKYLIPKMSTETINQVLPKKRESALSYAIKKGLVDIVELLIKYGACMKTKVTLDEQIPIYLCLKCISTATKKNFYEVFSFDDKKFIKENPFESKDERKKMIKTHDFGSAVFDHEKEIMFDKMNNDPKHKLIKKAIMKEMPLEFLGYTSNSVNFYKIFDIIVENTKDIDIPHRHGITPLMFATELNEINLVKKLIDKGANIDFYNDENYKAYDYAKANQNQELMELLE